MNIAGIDPIILPHTHVICRHIMFSMQFRSATNNTSETEVGTFDKIKLMILEMDGVIVGQYPQLNKDTLILVCQTCSSIGRFMSSL